MPGGAQNNAVRKNSIMTEYPIATVDKTEPIIIASFLLPYEIERDKRSGELNIQRCFHNPTLLYGTLESMMSKKHYNFKWVGIISTLEDVSQQEIDQLEAKFNKLNAYPIFMTAEELKPYLNFYENILRPLFHNFKDLYDMKNESLIYWKDFCDVNKRVADKIVELKNKLGTKNQTIWIHNNHLVMVPLYVKK